MAYSTYTMCTNSIKTNKLERMIFKLQRRLRPFSEDIGTLDIIVCPSAN